MRAHLALCACFMVALVGCGDGADSDPNAPRDASDSGGGTDALSLDARASEDVGATDASLGGDAELRADAADPSDAGLTDAPPTIEDSGSSLDASDAGELKLGRLRVYWNGEHVATATGAVDLGDIVVASIGTRHTFVMKNVGSGDLDVASFRLTGTDASMFSLDGESALLAPSQEASFVVSFRPLSEGAKTATLHIASDDPYVAEYTFALSGTGVDRSALDPDTDGDWSAFQFVAYDTIESRIVVRVGDIDNLGFGWPSGFEPFSGQSTPAHGFPWTPSGVDPAGTDRIMVVSSYTGAPPHGSDGYTAYTSRPGNLPEPITLNFDLRGSLPSSAVLQIFVDDFQAPTWGAHYEVTLDGVRAPFIEDVINLLVQTGPIGKLVTWLIPPEFVELLNDGELVISIDDPTTGAGDGFAIDFVKLYIDVYGFKNTGRITGTVTELGGAPGIDGARISASGVVTSTSTPDGSYELLEVPAGFVHVRVEKPGYQMSNAILDLPANTTLQYNVQLSPE